DQSSTSKHPTPVPASTDSDAVAARLTVPAPVAQGIERCPAEAEVACSNHAGRMAQPRAFGGVDAPESELVAPACSTSLEVDDGRSLRGRRRAVGLKATFETRLWAALAAWVP